MWKTTLIFQNLQFWTMNVGLRVILYHMLYSLLEMFLSSEVTHLEGIVRLLKFPPSTS